jgi:hypothetical protein
MAMMAIVVMTEAMTSARADLKFGKGRISLVGFARAAL